MAVAARFKIENPYCFFSLFPHSPKIVNVSLNLFYFFIYFRRAEMAKVFPVFDYFCQNATKRHLSKQEYYKIGNNAEKQCHVNKRE